MYGDSKTGHRPALKKMTSIDFTLYQATGQLRNQYPISAPLLSRQPLPSTAAIPSPLLPPHFLPTPTPTLDIHHHRYPESPTTSTTEHPPTHPHTDPYLIYPLPLPSSPPSVFFSDPSVLFFVLLLLALERGAGRDIRGRGRGVGADETLRGGGGGGWEKNSLLTPF